VGEQSITPRPVQWAVVDVETTGLRPSTDRIIEIGVVRLDDRGREIGAWTTLIDPERDIGPTRIHGITTRDVRGAPKFKDVAPDLLSWLGDAVVVAHNANFDTTFLSSECRRVGIAWGPVTGVCTMITVVKVGLCRSRALSDICRELGIALTRQHTALDDARATSQLLLRLLPPKFTIPSGAPAWPYPRTPCAVRVRSDPPTRRDASRVASLAPTVGVPASTAELDAAAALSYLALLDQVLEDRRLTGDEVEALKSLASEWRVGPDAARALHEHYVHGLWELALRDGVVTAAERNDIEIVAELLDVPLELDVSVSSAGASTVIVTSPVGAPTSDLAGKSVCFTGESVCSIWGVPFDRAKQEELAAGAGLVVKSGVSRKLDILVLADPDSMSGKARLARELGVRCMAEPVFWRQLGVPID
jgi:DNA polymerase-3 subunit epsilon